MTRRLRAVGLGLTVIFAVAGLSYLKAENDTPRESGVVERAERRLAQLDFSVSGPPEIVSQLVAEDFKIRVNLKSISEFQLDRFCDDPGRSPESTGATASYLFYFDQPHLTLPGRQRGLDLARSMIPELIRDGSRGMVLSNSRTLAVVEDFTSDPQRLLEALDRLEHDRTQWDVFSTEEESRVDRVVEALNKDDQIHRAISMARRFQREERWHTERNLRRLEVSLSRLATQSPPKAVVYFADSLRSNAGAHYLSFFGESLRDNSTVSLIGSSSFNARVPLDRVIDEAVAQGIRIYPILAQGQQTSLDLTHPDGLAMSKTRTVPASAQARHRDTQNTLGNLAAETGGEAFLRGRPARKIARGILDDFSCMFVVTYDPLDLPENAPLRVVVKIKREGVKLQSRGRTVIRGESARMASRLRSAFLFDRDPAAESELTAQLVPTDFDDGTYSGLLQISAPGMALPSTVWDIGASIVFRDKVREEVSGRHQIRESEVGIVLEREIRIEPGLNEIVAVAHETTSDLILSARVQIDWPDPDKRRITTGPISVMQPEAAAFVRVEDQRSSGSLARPPRDGIDPTRPTALIGLVCRNKRMKGALDVERILQGGSSVEFPPLEFELADDRCAQIRDVIPARSLGPGAYRYTVRVLHEGELVDERVRPFVAN